MGFKTLTIKTSVYEKLLAMKRKNESFSDLFDRLSEKNITTLRQLRGCTEFTNKEEMFQDILKKRNERR